jgi:hypothetical protein
MSEEKGRSGRLAINWRELERAFEGGGDAAATEWYLDRVTGKLECLIEGDPDSEAVRARLDRDVERYARIEPPGTEEEYGWMEEFVTGVGNAKAMKDLERALQGAGAFKRFRDILNRYPDLRDEWFAVRERHTRESMLAWLAAQSIEPQTSIPPARGRPLNP